MTVSCPVCGAENHDSAEFCSLCLQGIGFECSEYARPVSGKDGYLTRYPSSFDPGAPNPEEEAAYAAAAPEAEQVEVGEYGVRSGHRVVEGGPMFQPGAIPVPETGALGVPGSAGLVFDWGHAIWVCLGVAALAAAISIGLELILSFIGLVQYGSTKAGMAIVLIALLIPVMFAGFASGYRLRGYGWAVGLISVSTWAFFLRPLYFAFLSWLLTDSFEFAALLNRYGLAFVFGLFLPLGAFMGWMGEKRATTGLYF